MVHRLNVTASEHLAVRKELRIVVLEDNPAEARLLQETLSDIAAGMQFDLASELWEVSQERLDAADCAVIDLGLPDSSGLEALGWIRDLSPEIPIVVLTGLDDEATGLAAIRLGAQEYLVKHHADAYTVARAIRVAIVRKSVQHSLDPKLLSDAGLQDSLIQQLQAIGLAMKTTRGWMRQPSVAKRMMDHISAIQTLIDNVNVTMDNDNG